MPKEAHTYSISEIAYLPIFIWLVYKYMCGRYNCTQYGEMDRHLKVRYGEHVEISPLTFKKTRPSKRVLFEIII